MFICVLKNIHHSSINFTSSSFHFIFDHFRCVYCSKGLLFDHFRLLCIVFLSLLYASVYILGLMKVCASPLLMVDGYHTV